MTTLYELASPEPAGALQGLLADLRDPERAQRDVLRSILRRNATCEFGRRFDFGAVSDARTFAERVPICDYGTIRPALERMARGERDVLTSEAVCVWEQTGGSGGAKLVPYTARGLGEFRAGLQPWLESLQANVPAAFAGRAYWSISPAARRVQATAGGQVIGMQSDMAYFGEPYASRLSGALAVSPQAGAIEDLERWRCFTLAHLAACDDLALISVWSPTFWLELMHVLEQEVETIVAVLRGDRPAWDVESNWCWPPPRPRRAQQLLAAVRDATPAWQAFWPGLALVSCWSHARSEPWAQELARMFPRARLQGKGLLATEGLVTVPIDMQCDPVLALRSGFFEFVDAQGRTRLAHELEIGARYDVLLTTSGGLYRYAIGDRVLVTGRIDATPTLRFVGRADATCDLCGEKLDDAFVAIALATLGLKFGMLVVGRSRRGYELVVDERELSPRAASTCAANLDAALCANPQYAYARRLGQLHPIAARCVRDPVSAWLRRGMGRGQRLGDVKLPSLCAGDEACDVFGLPT